MSFDSRTLCNILFRRAALSSLFVMPSINQEIKQEIQARRAGLMVSK